MTAPPRPPGPARARARSFAVFFRQTSIWPNFVIGS
jgi:hypothetical protein